MSKVELLTNLRGGPPLPASPALFGGTVYTLKDIVPLLASVSCPFAIMDWCSDKYDGGCDVYHMSDEYAKYHGWAMPKSSEDMAQGLSDPFRQFQM
jgi:hypothetical protein